MSEENNQGNESVATEEETAPTNQDAASPDEELEAKLAAGLDPAPEPAGVVIVSEPVNLPVRPEPLYRPGDAIWIVDKFVGEVEKVFADYDSAVANHQGHYPTILKQGPKYCEEDYHYFCRVMNSTRAPIAVCESEARLKFREEAGERTIPPAPVTPPPPPRADGVEPAFKPGDSIWIVDKFVGEVVMVFDNLDDANEKYDGHYDAILQKTVKWRAHDFHYFCTIKNSTRAPIAVCERDARIKK